jgi:hypothetical protein
MQIIAKVSATPRSPTTASGEAEPLAKELLEDLERIPETAKVEACTSSFETSMSKAIVSLPLLGIREHLIGLIDIFETGLSIGRIADVRMVIACHPTVGLLDLCLRRRTINPQYFIVVESSCHSSPSS